MNKYISNINDGYSPDVLVEQMFAIVRAAVLNIPLQLQENDHVNWDQIRVKAAEQGILAWIWDGISSLSVEIQPSRFQRISFDLSAREIWNRYGQQKGVLMHMVEICRQNNMKLLLLKGIGLSELYPKPESRPSGDIDVFFFDKYEKGNELFNQGDFHFGGKHAEFTFEGVHIENHLTMINTQTKKQRRVEHYIERGLGNVVETADGYYTLPLMENLVYLLMHTLGHLNSAFVLPYRNIFDFALFLHKNRSSIPPEDCKNTMRKLKLGKSFELILYLSEWISSLSFQEYHSLNIPSRDVERAKRLVVERESKMDLPLSMLYIKQFVLRRKYDCKRHWLYKYLPRTYAERFRYAFNIEKSILFRKLFRVPSHVTVKDYLHK